MTKTTRKQKIQNPEKWIGRYVRHMANWEEFLYGDKYTVCEWTGKLMMTDDEHNWFEEEIETVGHLYDPCYSWSEQAAMEMLEYAEKHPEKIRKVRWIGR